MFSIGVDKGKLFVKTIRYAEVASTLEVVTSQHDRILQNALHELPQ